MSLIRFVKEVVRKLVKLKYKMADLALLVGRRRLNKHRLGKDLTSIKKENLLRNGSFKVP